MYRRANCHEELVFERVERNIGDPGCRRSYAFLISGVLVVDGLRDTLHALIFNHYQLALSTFVRKVSGLYVYSAGMPANVLDYSENPQRPRWCDRVTP
jgi:hypothetical protein